MALVKHRAVIELLQAFLHIDSLVFQGGVPVVFAVIVGSTDKCLGYFCPSTLESSLAEE